MSENTPQATATATPVKAARKKATTTRQTASKRVTSSAKPKAAPKAQTAAKKAGAKASSKASPTVKKAVKKTSTSPVSKAVKTEKVKKPKLVRDSFTMPKDEYSVIDSLKQRAIKHGQIAKKSEILRAGVKALAAMSDIQFKAALSNVPTIKTGRPKTEK